MPFSLSKYRNVTKLVQVDFDGEIINVTYRPGEVTPARLTNLRREQQEAVDRGEPLPEGEAWARNLSMIEKWDIMGDDGPLPLTPEVLEEIPTVILKTIYQAVLEDTRPTEERSKRSRRGSF